MRHKRIRKKIKGTAECPRVSIFRSNKYIYLQLIDDEKRRTLAAVDDRNLKLKNEKKNELSEKIASAFVAGKLLAEMAKKQKLKKIVFDRGGYRYHGRIKAVADGLREGGLEF